MRPNRRRHAGIPASICAVLQEPILGVVSVFAIIAAWKDYLWPKLVLPNPAVQPLSVRLPDVASQTELDVFLAALAIATLIPIAMFLVFQSVFLRSAGLGGAPRADAVTYAGDPRPRRAPTRGIPGWAGAAAAGDPAYVTASLAHRGSPRLTAAARGDRIAPLTPRA